MRSLERVNIRSNERTYVRTYVLTYIRTGQTLYPLHNFVVRGDNKLFYWHFCILYVYVRQRVVKSQNKMDFREIPRSMCLTQDSTAAS